MRSIGKVAGERSAASETAADDRQGRSRRRAAPSSRSASSVFAISGELPFGTLSAPGAGMMPKLMAGLMMAFAAALMVGGAIESAARRDRLERPLARRARRPDHAVAVAALPAARDFSITMTLLVFALLVLVERRNVLHTPPPTASGSPLFAYWLFGKALKSPLERGLLWF